MSSAADLITRVRDFNPDNVTYAPPRVNKRGGKNIALQYNSRKLTLQFPVQFTWGVNERVAEDTGRVSYDLSLVFESRDEEDTAGQFFHKLTRLQEKILEDAVSNTRAWFGKAKMSKEVADAMMYPILKYPKNKETGEPDLSRDPSVKLKVPFWDGEFDVELYNMDKVQIFGSKIKTDKTPVDLIPSKSHISGLMQCGGVWFAGGRFGVTWKLVQCKVRPPVTLRGFCMLDDSDDDAECRRLDKKELEEEVAANVELAVNEVQSSDDEPPAPKKKKTVKKKRVKKKPAN